MFDVQAQEIICPIEIQLNESINLNSYFCSGTVQMSLRWFYCVGRMTKHTIFCQLLGLLCIVSLLFREVAESELACASFVPCQKEPNQ